MNLYKYFVQIRIDIKCKYSAVPFIAQNEKIPAFRVTRPCLNLLVKLFSGFLNSPFKMHKIIFFPEKKNVCLPYLKFSDMLLETHLFFFIWPNLHHYNMDLDITFSCLGSQIFLP